MEYGQVIVNVFMQALPQEHAAADRDILYRMLSVITDEGNAYLIMFIHILYRLQKGSLH